MFEKYVYVNTEPENKQELVIVIIGYVEPIPMGVVEVHPRKIELGDVKVGAANLQKITVTNTGDAALQINEVVSRKYKAVYFKGPLGVPAGESREIEFSVTAPDSGRYFDYILIHSDARNVTDEGYKLVITGSAQSP